MNRSQLLLVAPGPYRGGLYRCVQLNVAGADWTAQVRSCLERGRTPQVVEGGRRLWRRRRSPAAELADDLDALTPVTSLASEPGRLWLFGVSLVAGAAAAAGESAASLERWLVQLYPAVGRMVDLAGHDPDEAQIAAAEARLLLDGLRADTDRIVGTVPDQAGTPPLMGV